MSNGSSVFTEFGKNLRVEVSSDPETCTLPEVVEKRLDRLDQAGLCRLYKHAEQSCDPQASRGRDSSAAALIHQQQISASLLRQYDRLGFSVIEFVAELINLPLIPDWRHNDPGGVWSSRFGS